MTKKLLCGLLIGLIMLSFKTAYPLSEQGRDDVYRQIYQITSELIDNYEHQLGFDAHPFAYTFSTHEANDIYQQLLTQKGKTSICENSWLYKIKLELIKKGSNFDLKLIQDFVTQATVISQMAGGDSIVTKQSYLIALRMLHPYIQILAAMGTGATTEDASADKKPQEKKEKQDQTPPKWPREAGDSYKPNTKDLGNKGGSGDNKKIIISEVNFKTPVFGQVTYDTINRKNQRSPFKVTELPWSMDPSPIKDKGITNEYMKVFPIGEKDLKLFMPTGYIPGQPEEDGATITAEKSGGGYRLFLTKDFEKINIPLYKAESQQLSDFLKDLYTINVGISVGELPEKTQVAIIHKYDPSIKHNQGELTKAIATHIASAYLYSSGARPETDLVDALKAGAFQCDMAAYIMVAILRDVYKVPARTVGGYRAKKANKGNQAYSYLLMPTPNDGHAWVEAFIDGKWRYFDPTPTTKDKEEADKDQQKQDFSDQTDENSDPPQDDKNNQQEKGEKTDSKDTGKDRSQYGRDNTKDEPTDKKVETSANKNAENKEPFIHPELDDNLLKLLSESSGENPLKKLAWKNILMYALHPAQSSTSIQNIIAAYEKVFDYSPTFKRIFDKGKEVHKATHESLVDWLARISNKLFIQEINITYKELKRVIKALALYREVVDKAGLQTLSLGIEKNIATILRILDKLNSTIATDLALVDDFETEAPHLLWSHTKEKYGLSTVGPNIPTQNLALDIRNGKLNNEKLINFLYPYTDFILNSSMKPGKMAVKTWQQGALIRGGDVLLLNRPTDWRNTILTRPDLDLMDNIKQKTAYHMTKRKIVTTESKKEQDEAERITIVGFDVSGSMAGDLSEFQAALITAFTCRALDDLTKAGKPRHKVLLVPFDDKVGKPIKVNNADDALSLISNRHSWLQNTGGGTDIQKFLLQAFALIAEAQNESKKTTKSPLDIANIIIMSDGQSPINYDEIAKARKAIHRDTPIQAMFIALGSTNDDLRRFARDAKKMGMDSEDLYRYFTTNQITDILQQTKTTNLEKYKNAFYSLKKPNDIDQSDRNMLVTLFSDTLDKIKVFSEKATLRVTASQKPNDYHIDLSRKINKIDRKLREDREIEGWLHELRGWFAEHEIYKDQKLFAMIAEDLMVNFEKTLNIKFADLAHYELEELKHLLRSGKEN